MIKPLAIDLFCGLGGWTEGLLAEGWDVIGFDIERRPYPAQLVLQDVMTLHGSQFKNAALIVASPPCQAYSYRAMPWKRAKALPPPDNSLFEACFRIQKEACEAAGRHIPMVVENVLGAQRWVGPAKWHYGSYYLWGDVPALMPMTTKVKIPGFRFDGSGKSFQLEAVKVSGLDWSKYGTPGYTAEAFNTTAEQRMRATKNDGGSWFNIAHNTTSGVGNNPDGRKTIKQRLTDLVTTSTEGIKVNLSGRAWYAEGLGSVSSGSVSRKFASAQIAKIPFPLARHIARCYFPVGRQPIDT